MSKAALMTLSRVLIFVLFFLGVTVTQPAFTVEPETMPSSSTEFSDETEYLSLKIAIEQFMSGRGDKSLRWPVKGRVISRFGPLRETDYINDGINISAPDNAPVTAVKPGLVIYSDDALRAYGNLVIVKHPGSKLVSVYSHLAEVNVNVGDWLDEGQLIGLLGSSGVVSRPQLHFELRFDGKPKDPLLYMLRSPSDWCHILPVLPIWFYCRF